MFNQILAVLVFSTTVGFCATLLGGLICETVRGHVRTILASTLSAGVLAAYGSGAGLLSSLLVSLVVFLGIYVLFRNQIASRR
ncbi:MAG: hypothetical protein K2W82_17265 [Candidatus Obscuribacterales bacterium]|jgi:ABC-type multidrug transport system permease subunit|nr:hypothetical protein [Candidatus Obscuribacterales bacterium]